jgi:hypothetical protein
MRFAVCRNGCCVGTELTSFSHAVSGCVFRIVKARSEAASPIRSCGSRHAVLRRASAQLYTYRAHPKVLASAVFCSGMG